MTARQMRRARKLARKHNPDHHQPSLSQSELSDPDALGCSQLLDWSESHPISEAQLAANRANAQLSTGAKTPEGKSKVSLNAVKTALTGRTVLLPSEDAALYEHHILAYQEEFQAVGRHEADLVQSIADCAWRLGRIPGLELAVYAQGHVQFANNFDSFDAALRPSLIDLHIATIYEKQLRNLHLQEARLHRRREKDLAELRQLQKERKAKEAQEQTKKAQQAAEARQAQSRNAQPAKNGFEFSTSEIAALPFAENHEIAVHPDIAAAAAVSEPLVTIE